jgi:hypothetical protein
LIYDVKRKRERSREKTVRKGIVDPANFRKRNYLACDMNVMDVMLYGDLELVGKEDMASVFDKPSALVVLYQR